MPQQEDPARLDVRALLRAYGLRPKKGLAQHFLVEPGALRKVVAAAEVEAQDTVLEVGAGLGGLTRELADLVRRVVAVELDSRLIPPLKQVLAGRENVRIVVGDIMEMDPSDLMQTSDYQVVANIPYYITSALMRHLLEARLPPHRMTLTIQREVAQRICAGPGSMSLLALSVQVYGTPHLVARLPAGAFYPPPKVDSAVIRVDMNAEPAIPLDRLDTFFRFAKAGFSQKRKTLQNALAGGLGWSREQTGDLLNRAGIDPRRRAQTLSLDEWGAITRIAVEGQGA